MNGLESLNIKIFSDGAKIEDFRVMATQPYIRGFTTNPSLMRKAGVDDYEGFIREVLPIVGEKPVSFEVISDDFGEMKGQAHKLHSCGKNVYVKIPVMNTRGQSSIPLIKDLVEDGLKLNITAVFTVRQVTELSRVLASEVPAIVSVFAGRIADTGINPVPIIIKCRDILKCLKKTELLWASPRELLNIIQAEESGCNIITLLPDILAKLKYIGYDLQHFSLDTVKMFYNDAVMSGLQL